MSNSIAAIVGVFGVVLSCLLLWPNHATVPTDPRQIHEGHDPTSVHVLASEIGRSGVFVCRWRELVNTSDMSVTVSVSAKSCGCLSVRGLPNHLGPGEAWIPEIELNLEPTDGRRQNYVQFSLCPEESDEAECITVTRNQLVAVHQDITVTPKLVLLTPIGGTNDLAGRFRMTLNSREKSEVTQIDLTGAGDALSVIRIADDGLAQRSGELWCSYSNWEIHCPRTAIDSHVQIHPVAGIVETSDGRVLLLRLALKPPSKT